MNHKEAEKKLFSESFLIGGIQRGSALKFLFKKGDAESVRILVDAVDRKHGSSGAIKKYLGRLSNADVCRVLIECWKEKRQDWLHPIVVERALPLGMEGELPLERESAWLVAGHLGGRTVGRAAEAYAERVLQDAPAFMVAFLCKIAWSERMAKDRSTTAAILALLADPDRDISKNAEAYLRALPNNEGFNELIVDEWIRTENKLLAELVKTPRLPADAAKVALVSLVNGDVAGYRNLKDNDGKLLAEAMAYATPAMRKRINEVVLSARDGALADAYRQAVAAGGEGADHEVVIKALIVSGNENGLVEATRTMVLSEVLPLCEHWAKTGRRPEEEKYRKIVERAVKALEKMPSVKIEPAPRLPKGLEDLFEIWQREAGSDADLRKELEEKDPFIRAKALFQGSERGIVKDELLQKKAASEDWPERLVAALRGCRPADGKPDHVAWINTAAGLDADLLAARIQCGPDELQWSDNLRKKLAKAPGSLGARNLALAETLCAFRSLYGGFIGVGEDDSAQNKGDMRVRDVDRADLDF